jgi:methylthioribose-1-phosphate isomerase
MFKPTVYWSQGAVKLIDQTRLPHRTTMVICRDLKTLATAIRRLQVRGAPAIGVAAGFGIQLASTRFKGSGRRAFDRHLERAAYHLAASRPTAVNLFHVLDEMKALWTGAPEFSVAQLKRAIQAKAAALYEENRQVCRRMGDHGERLISDGMTALTICNAGALATVDYGTALGVFYSAKAKGKRFEVFACETRPLLQGARLTVWELERAKVPVTLICDSMAAAAMRSGKIGAVFTGADRVAANGDTANKIGTYSLAVLAKYHKIPFYVVAPRSTFDFRTSSGSGIPIEERSADEVRGFQGAAAASARARVWNPAFDVTPARLITAFVTERGVIVPPLKKNLKRALCGHG